MRCRGGKDGCDSAMVSTVPIIALLRAAGFAETTMVNGCERFAFNVVPYNLNLDSDNARSSNLRARKIINETAATDTSRNRIYLFNPHCATTDTPDANASIKALPYGLHLHSNT